MKFINSPAAAEQRCFSDSEIAQRKAFLEIGEDEQRLLKGFNEQSRIDCSEFVDDFYNHLKAFEEPRSFVENEELLEQLKKAQTEYFDRLTAGEYNRDYVINRLQAGITHQKIGLKPKWYMGAHGQYLSWLLPKIGEYCGDDREKFISTCLAALKITMFDIELANDAYFHAEHEKLRLLAKAFDSNVEGVLILDNQGVILHANKKIEDITGFSPAKIIDKNFNGFLSKDYPDHNKQIKVQAFEAGQWQGKVWLIRENGSTFPAWMNISGVRDDEQNLTNFVAEFSDISIYEQTEQTLHARTEELIRSNEELEQFAYVASHDLQEPLRMVSSYTQLIGHRYKGKLDEDADEFIHYAVDGASRMQGLINDLLKYSRVGSKSKPFVPVDCNAVLERVMLNLKIAIEESGAIITHDMLPIVQGDDSMLVQLFQNLISNAIKFRSAETPKVHISVSAENTDWVFRVKDNGIGIAQECTNRIFIIFQRLHTKEEYPGTGIGLSICKKIVTRHGGVINVEPSQEQGSIFRFTMPISEGVL